MDVALLRKQHEHQPVAHAAVVVGDEARRHVSVRAGERPEPGHGEHGRSVPDAPSGRGGEMAIGDGR